MINNESAVSEADMAGLNRSGKPIPSPPSKLDLIKLRRSNVCCAFISIQLYRTGPASRSLFLVHRSGKQLLAHYEVVLRSNRRHRRAVGHLGRNNRMAKYTLSEMIS
jgi:hypothetical protein